MSEVAWAEAMKALIRADSPEEWGRIVTAQRQVLLTPVTLLSMQRALDDAERRGDPTAAPMRVVYDFLQAAQEKGVPAAVAQERARRDAITHAGAAYLSAGVWETPDVLTQFQSTLLQPDAIRVVRRMAALAAQEQAADPLAPVRQRISDLKLAMLDDARAHGPVDATRRYTEAMTALIEESQRTYG
jgi:hypothetical protein